VPHARSYASGARSCPQALFRYDLSDGFRTGGGNHASLYSRNLCCCGRDLFQRARRCIGADSNNSKRRSSFSRTFGPRHFNCHELHDVLQLAVGELPNELRPFNTAAGPGQLKLCGPPVERDGERGMSVGMHFDPVSLPNELRAIFLNNWSMIDRKAQRPWLRWYYLSGPGRAKPSTNPAPPTLGHQRKAGHVAGRPQSPRLTDAGTSTRRSTST
jgi:hypothetical protein